MELLLFQVRLSSQVNASVQVIFIPVNLSALLIVFKVKPLVLVMAATESRLSHKGFNFQLFLARLFFQRVLSLT